MSSTILSKVEQVKNDSDYLAGKIASQLQNSKSFFEENEIQLLKFHGTYQQFDRDTATELKQKGLEKEFSFMIRTRIPGGILDYNQYIELDSLANQFSNSSLRITTRQTFQFHGVLKKNLKKTISNISKMLITTYGACGDVVRNVTTIAAPIKDIIHEKLRKDAEKISSNFVPKSTSYGQIWINGEKYEYKKKEPLYGKCYLPRKFKIGITIPEDNSVDVLTNDIAIFLIHKNSKVLGYNIAIGGGLGMTHNKPETFPYLAKPVLFCKPDYLENILEEIIKIQRDFGDRTNRKHARLKYLVEEKGTDWFKKKIEKELKTNFDIPKKINNLKVIDHLGWHEQGDGKWYIGIFIPSGRIKDDKNIKIKSGLRDIIKTFKPSVILSTDQNIFLGDIQEKNKDLINKILKKNLIVNEITKINRWFLACPALPTCGLALAEAERVRDSLVNKIDKILLKHNLSDEKISIRITGCPNGCARPYAGDIGIIGRTPNHYALYTGGDFEGSRLNRKIVDKVSYENLVLALEQLFIFFKKNKINKEGFGDFCNRVGTDIQFEKIKEILNDKVQ
ncbi:MAG: Sulfite reductase [ferredoxin] [Alphaproteobacteria bacterium MarineAlpha6_Bin4]|nr:MAG: Sulfite reductase [ferredoxin] [Alphaproteobacteria bacterium MarineAlpha6_Bin4]